MRKLLLSAGALCLVIVGLSLLRGDDPPLPPRDEMVQQLIEQLGVEDFYEREAAQRSLQGLGERPLAWLRVMMKTSQNPEIRWRAEQILQAPRRESLASGLQLTLIPAGEFQQGSPDEEVGRNGDEQRHLVQISRAFYLGQREVSQREYQLVMKHNPSWFTATAEGKEKVAGLKHDELPVERVSWFDAVAFCNELSRLDNFRPYYQLDELERQGESIRAARVKVLGGFGYRLPSEAEWEYACRAGSGMPYHWGAATNGNTSNVRGVSMPGGYGGAIVGPNLQRTSKVGNYESNRWALFDMHGNVGEWCDDYYTKDYYAAAPRKDPRGPATGLHRVWRGGSWLQGETSSRSAARNFLTPDERKEYLGFRVARDL